MDDDVGFERAPQGRDTQPARGSPRSSVPASTAEQTLVKLLASRRRTARARERSAATRTLLGGLAVAGRPADGDMLPAAATRFLHATRARALASRLSRESRSRSRETDDRVATFRRRVALLP